MPLLLFTAIAVLQWLVVSLLSVEPPFDQTTFLFGNLQIIAILAVWRLIDKYVYIGEN